MLIGKCDINGSCYSQLVKIYCTYTAPRKSPIMYVLKKYVQSF